MENLPDTSGKVRHRLKYRGTKCLNCGHPLDISDRYCPNCSQANSTKKLSIKDFFDEFFASVISYDSKLLNTLGSLLLRPGKITKEYINGKRVSYTNPFRFLLSLAIIYFLMLNLGGGFSTWDDVATANESDTSDFNWNTTNFLFKNGAEREQVMQALDSMEIRDRINVEMQQKDSIILADPQKYFFSINDSSFLVRFYHKSEFFITLISKRQMLNFQQGIEKYKIPDRTENRASFTLAKNLLKIKTQPGRFISALISKLPFAVFFFLPVFALFIWLVYIRKKYNYTDHLIFSFHNTALLFILLIISYLIDSIFDINSNWVLLTIFSIYLFAAMRKFYGQGVFKTIVKYLFLNAIFFILALFAILILFTGNIFTF